MSRSHRSRRRVAAAALVAAIGVLVGLLLVGGSVGAAEDPNKPDGRGLLPVHPSVTIDEAKGKDDAECVALTAARKAAEDVVDARLRAYNQDLAAARGRAESQDGLNESLRQLTAARMELIKARYAEAACYLRLTNGGKGDKCQDLWLDYNRTADLMAQQEIIVQRRQDDLDRATGVRGIAERQLIDLRAALAAAKKQLADLAAELARQQKKIKNDADCKNSDFKRPAPKKEPNPRNPAPSTDAPAPEGPDDTCDGDGTGSDVDGDVDPALDYDPYFDVADLVDYDLDLDPDVAAELGLVPAEGQPGTADADAGGVTGADRIGVVEFCDAERMLSD